MAEQKTSLISNHFYGKRSGTASWHLVEKRVKMMQENPLGVNERPRLLGDTHIWTTFPRQSMALSFAKKTGMQVLTFAFEGKVIGEGGRRAFLVCHPKILWQVMKDRPLSSRCVYEVIPEYQVCKLYFDLEFLIDLNPTLCGVKATQTFIHIVNYYLKKEFGVECGLEHVLDLDSTTPLKFSRHLIYNLEKVGFTNNFQVGYFVKMICDELGKVAQGFCNSPIPHISKEDIKNLFVKTESSTVMICDLAVYSKNRNFRTFGSTKFGKQVPLVLSDENLFIPSQSSDEQYFLDSLITFVGDDIKILTYEGEMNPGMMSRNYTTINGRSCLLSKTYSPYIEIEKFINNYLGGDDLIRTWHYFNQDELLVFEIDKQHRFCANVGREHKSNSVMYVVNLKKGVFYQKCYDPNCHGFKSCEMALPPETMPWKLEDMLDNWFTKNDAFKQNSSVIYEPQIGLPFLQKPTGPSSSANATDIMSNFTQECNKFVEESNFTNSISDEELLKIKH